MRAFIALDIPSKCTNEIAVLSKQLSSKISGRFMKRETFHVTLAFLGDITDSQASDVIKIMDSVIPYSQKITLNPTGLGKFGKPTDATLFLELQLTDELNSLVSTLRNKLQQNAIYFDQKKFRPHITLARRASIPKQAMPQLYFPEQSRAETVTLYKSTLTQQGAQYKALYSLDLP